MFGVKASATRGLVTKSGDWLWDDVSEGAPRSKRLEYDDERSPRSAYEGDVLGFRVASGPACDDDEGFLGATASLAGLERAHAKHIKNAKRRWKMFAAWLLKEHKMRLPAPGLWLTTDERA